MPVTSGLGHCALASVPFVQSYEQLLFDDMLRVPFGSKHVSCQVHCNKKEIGMRSGSWKLEDEKFRVHAIGPFSYFSLVCVVLD